MRVAQTKEVVVAHHRAHVEPCRVISETLEQRHTGYEPSKDYERHKAGVG
jgi:hypothetical protein